MNNTRSCELHIHTKMSVMDSVGDTEEYFAAAHNFGFHALAITDHANVRAFPEAYRMSKMYGIKLIYGMEGYMTKTAGNSSEKFHVSILVKNRAGLKALYELVTLSYTEYFDGRPCIPKDVLQKYRENLLIGSACCQGELYRAIESGAGEKELAETVLFYDYLEVQPHNDREVNKKIIELGRANSRIVAATSDAHYAAQEDELGRMVLQGAMGFEKYNQMPPLYMRVARDMHKEFDYLDEETIKKIVVENPKTIAGLTDDTFPPIPEGDFMPKVKDADKKLSEQAKSKLIELYGESPNAEVQNRFDDELEKIVANGFASLYLIPAGLVNYIKDMGEFVGTRGSVGSSFIAYLLGITEINPLMPHYICPVCHCVEFSNEANCGADLSDKSCPKCGQMMKKDGFDIPFESFAGADGDRMPDIDMNFPYSKHEECYKYLKNTYGEDKIFRAGTVATLANKTAEGYIARFEEETGKTLTDDEKEYAYELLLGVARATGMHPGGIMFVPEDMDVHDFTPLQYPANCMDRDLISHFDFRALHDTLLKLDVLYHDDPEILKQLWNLTGLNPTSIPLNDEATMCLFKNADTTGVTEFANPFVKNMMKIAKPESFDDLIRISALSHGTGTWIANADGLIKSKTAKLCDVVSCRDDVFMTLLKYGLDKRTAYYISERVRKGRGTGEEGANAMTEQKIPDWFIASCNRIKYSFPRAHAANYVLMAYRIAYYKAHYPLEFYCAFFNSCKGDTGDLRRVLGGAEAVSDMLSETDDLSFRRDVLEVYEEFYNRGYSFETDGEIDFSEDVAFEIRGEKIAVSNQIKK